MSTQQLSSTFQALLAQFNGAHVAKICQAGAAIGLKPQSTYNSIQKKTFPLPIVGVGAHRGVRVTDIAQYLDGLTPVRRPGRPSHKERAAREAAKAALLDIDEQERAACEAAKRGLSVRELRAQSSIPRLELARGAKKQQPQPNK